MGPELAVAVSPAAPEAAGMSPEQRRSGARWARLVSLLALAGVTCGFVYAGSAAYHVWSDSFVAPLILSPDNDLVIQSKLSLSRLVGERQAMAARVEQSEAAIGAARHALDSLERLRTHAGRALDWSRALSENQASLGTSDLERVGAQRLEVADMLAKQQAFVADLARDLEAGLVHRADVAREEKALAELRLMALQNQRDELQAAAQLRTASLAQDNLRATSQGRPRLSTPEMLAQRDQLSRIDLERLKLDADVQGKTAQLRVDREALVKADELIGQMKGRPIFRAIESSQNVAFVPYSQIDGVAPGADVYQCELWGIFACDLVGRVAELLPGEVATQDPWGTPARGQYLLLALKDPAEARAKTLRVRRRDAIAAPAPLPGMRAPASPPAALSQS